MTHEKKDHPRIVLNQMVELSPGRERMIEASGVTIGSGGILCATEDKIEQYTRVYLMLSFVQNEHSKKIECEGVVVRSEKQKGKFITAIEFSSIDKDKRDLLHKYINMKMSAS